MDIEKLSQPEKEKQPDCVAKDMASHLISNFDPSQRIEILKSVKEILRHNIAVSIANKREDLEYYEQNLKLLEEGI